MPDGLRTAIERTFAATAEGAAETRERAGAALDEVTRRGREASGAAGRVIEAIEGMRLASLDDLRVVNEDVKALSKEIEVLARRVEELEAKPKVES